MSSIVDVVEGSVAPRFEPLRQVLAEGLQPRGELGCALSVYLGGEIVCDLWAGEAAPGRPWRRDTVTVAFSAGKGMLALCCQLLVSRGELDIERRVADYWPEFAAEGKGDVQVRHLLSHTAGLPTFPRYWEVVGLDGHGFEDWDLICSRLAAAPPAWKPGTRYLYHAITYGYLVGEVIRRITGLRPGRFFDAEVAQPLGLDCWIGVPESARPRVAELQTYPPPESPEVGEAVMAAFRKSREAIRAGDAYAPDALAFCSPVFLHPDREDISGFPAALFNEPWIHAIEMPSSNPITDARSLARMYSAIALAEMVPADLNELFSTPEPLSAGGVGEPMCVGFHSAAGGRGFGHAGVGGIYAFADPGLGLGFGYVKNRMLDGAHTARLVKAVYECLS